MQRKEYDEIVKKMENHNVHMYNFLYWDSYEIPVNYVPLPNSEFIDKIKYQQNNNIAYINSEIKNRNLSNQVKWPTFQIDGKDYEDQTQNEITRYWPIGIYFSGKRLNNLSLSFSKFSGLRYLILQKSSAVSLVVPDGIEHVEIKDSKFNSNIVFPNSINVVKISNTILWGKIIVPEN